ncbi:MAG TPA: creatininase [Rhodobiaceae bacterium]|nr:creatininase [Rhodobiaceae bacterium]
MTSWAKLTAPQIGDLVERQGRRMAVLPIGATEQHGPHLASGTDTLLAEAICGEACRRRNVLMLPAIPYGCSFGHSDAWPGTISLSPETLASVLCEVADWAIRTTGIDRLLFISGHATNGPSIETAILRLRYEHPDVRFATRGLWEISAEALRLYTLDAADIHANIAETSMVMALDPAMVQMDHAEDVQDVTIGKIWRYAMPAVTPNGVVGRPSESSATLGRDMLDRIIDDFEALLEAAEKEEWPEIPAATKGGAT